MAVTIDVEWLQQWGPWIVVGIIAVMVIIAVAYDAGSKIAEDCIIVDGARYCK